MIQWNQIKTQLWFRNWNIFEAKDILYIFNFSIHRNQPNINNENPFTNILE